MKLVNIGFGNMVSAQRVVTDSGHVIWSSLSPEQVSARFQEAPETEEETP